VGYSSKIEVDFEVPQWSLVELCLNGDCADPQALVDDAPADYEYRLSFQRGDGVIVRRSGTVSTEPFFVNGPRCEPRTFNAVLHVSRDAEVHSRPKTSLDN